MSNHRWSNDDKIKMKQMLDGGASYSMIALQFPDTNRSMIGSIIRREGWIGVSKNDCYTNQPKKQARPPKPVKKARSLMPPIIASILFLKKVSFAELQPFHCHWPVSEEPRMYCGEQRDADSSYCAYHHCQATRPDNKRAGKG